VCDEEIDEANVRGSTQCFGESRRYAPKLSVRRGVSRWQIKLPLRPIRRSQAWPKLPLTYKWHGKTVTEALPTPAAVRKAGREIAAFREYQRRGRELVEVNEKIYRLRPVEEEDLSEQEKNRRTPFRKRLRAK